MQGGAVSPSQVQQASKTHIAVLRYQAYPAGPMGTAASSGRVLAHQKPPPPPPMLQQCIFLGDMHNIPKRRVLALLGEFCKFHFDV